MIEPQTNDQQPVDIADDRDAVTCESCSTAHDCGVTVTHFDINLCPACDDKWRAAFAVCKHEWKADISPDGDDGYFCHRCGCFWVGDDLPGKPEGEAA